MAFTCEGRCGKFRMMIISALVTRIVFCLHCLIAFWRVFLSSSWEPMHYLVLCGIVGLFIETVITVYVRRGAEYKWFCPSVFFYLATIVPCIWILQFGMLSDRIRNRDDSEMAKRARNNNTNCASSVKKNIPNDSEGSLLENVFQVHLAQTQWVMMIEQLLLFVLILGRWMLPKGKISRNALSQLLLVYIGMAADIIELLEAFGEEQVKYSRMLAVIILSVWSVSLLQFTLVLTISKSRRPRTVTRDPTALESPITSTGRCCKSGTCCSGCKLATCCGSEVCGITITMVLQDGPFLALRLLLMISYGVRSHLHIFFTMKNALVLLLMLYRLFVLFKGPGKHAHARARARARAQEQVQEQEQEQVPMQMHAHSQDAWGWNHHGCGV